MYFLTKKEMAKVDKLMIESGITVSKMMEVVGFQIANFVNRINCKRVLIVCGPGNNGGDGICAGRFLDSRGYKVTVFISSKTLHDEPKRQLEILEKTEAKIIYELKELEKEIKKTDLVVDGLFGYNLRGEPKGDYSKIIEIMNDSGKRIISIDVPSGFDLSKGETKYCVKPSEVLCISFPKKGLERYKLYVVDIGVIKKVYKELGLVPIEFKEGIIEL